MLICCIMATDLCIWHMSHDVALCCRDSVFWTWKLEPWLPGDWCFLLLHVSLLLSHPLSIQDDSFHLWVQSFLPEAMKKSEKRTPLLVFTSIFVKTDVTFRYFWKLRTFCLTLIFFQRAVRRIRLWWEFGITLRESFWFFHYVLILGGFDTVLSAFDNILLIRLISETWKCSDVTKKCYGATNSSSETINRL